MKLHEITPSRVHQRGLVLEIVLVVLIALLLASAALFRSVDTSSTVSGNIAFKSDANNRAQLAFDQVIAWATNAANFNINIVDGQSDVASNYSARMLEVDAQGIPIVLKNPTSFDSAYTYTPPANALMNTDEMKVRYLIERMCTNDGVMNKNTCQYVYKGNSDSQDTGAHLKDPDKPALRVTVRVDGPRNTVSYIQATVSP